MNLGDESPWGDEPPRSTESTKEAGQPDASSKASDDIVAPSTSSVSAAPTMKSPRGRATRAPRKHGTLSTKLEAVDTSVDPLGPLGSQSEIPTQADEPPALPLKETAAERTSRPSTSVAQNMGPSGTPTIQSQNLASSDIAFRSRQTGYTQPISDTPARASPVPPPVEGPSKPIFSISVGDPHKVGDLTSSHTVYQVRTKTTSQAYRNPESVVSRRYKDFLWLYNQLHNEHPGVIVPPPPEKQSVGRFDAEFVESRRAALERMLNKITVHPVLQNDGDLKVFLESETFNVDVKQRERKDPDLTEGKGMFGSLSLSVGSGTKYIEQDDWFLDRRVYLDNLEIQLKALLKATDTAITQRKSLSEACGDLSSSLNSLSQVELSPVLTGPLASLSDLQLRIRDLYDRQAQQDVLTLGIVIDEYIRLIGSIKKAFEQRQKAWQHWHNAESDLQKRKSTLEKLMRSGRSQQDRLSQLQADVGDAERRSHQARLLFEDLGRGMRVELERFEKEKVEDFRMGVETYLESSVEAQKELIEIWETYLMHLDADEEDMATPQSHHATQSENEVSGANASMGASQEGESERRDASMASVIANVDED